MKKYHVKFRDEAIDDLSRLDKPVAQRVFDKIQWLAENFESVIPERLSGDFKELYKLRVGDWRVGYNVHADIITIHIIDHRSRIYKLSK